MSAFLLLNFTLILETTNTNLGILFTSPPPHSTLFSFSFSLYLFIVLPTPFNSSSFLAIFVAFFPSHLTLQRKYLRRNRVINSGDLSLSLSLLSLSLSLFSLLLFGKMMMLMQSLDESVSVLLIPLEWGGEKNDERTFLLEGEKNQTSLHLHPPSLLPCYHDLDEERAL